MPLFVVKHAVLPVWVEFCDAALVCEVFNAWFNEPLAAAEVVLSAAVEPTVPVLLGLLFRVIGRPLAVWLLAVLVLALPVELAVAPVGLAELPLALPVLVLPTAVEATEQLV